MAEGVQGNRGDATVLLCALFDNIVASPRLPLPSSAEPAEPAQGLVVSLDRGYPLVRTERGEERAQHAIELVKNSPLRAAVGDIVQLSKAPEQDMPLIVAIECRKSVLARKELVESIHEGAGKAKEQVLAANFDFVVIVQSLGKRELAVEYLERQLVMAHQSGAEVVVVLTKADLAKHLAADLAAARAAAGGSRVFCLSKVDAPPLKLLGPIEPTEESAEHLLHFAKQLSCCSELQEKEPSALQDLAAFARCFMPKRLGVLLGRSGVGKSTLVNLLLGEERQETGSVRSKDRAGRHVTVARRLVLLANESAVIDTPGMRTIGVLGAEAGLARTFPEITEASSGCRYRDCTHTHEPGCAVTAAVSAGIISARRLLSYRTLAAEVFD